MKTILRLFLVLVSSSLLLALPQLPQLPRGSTIPQFSPNGIWESPAGTKYNLRLTGENLQVKLEGTNATFLQYEVTLKHLKADDTLGDPNRYEGKGFFRAKLKSGKECRFETTWEIAVISEKEIVGSAPNYLDPDPQTCQAKTTDQVRIELKKK